MARPRTQRSIALGNKVWYAGRGERRDLCGHRLRCVPGTGPTRLKYRNHADLTLRNDVQQLEYFCGMVRPNKTVMQVGASVSQLASLAGSAGRAIRFWTACATARTARTMERC